MERYSDFMWDYYGGRPFRSGYYGGAGRSAFRMRAMEAGPDMGDGFGCGEKEIGRDMEYFEAMYPEKMKQLQRSVTDLCDTIDYEGSILYDEYPDRVGLRQLCDRVYKKELPEGAGEDEAEWLQAAIEVLLYHEVCRRRIRRRGIRRKYWKGY